MESAHDAREQIERIIGLNEELHLDDFRVEVRTNSGRSNSQKSVTANLISVDRGDGAEKEPETSLEDAESGIPNKIDGIAGRGSDKETIIEDIPVNVKRERQTLQSSCCHFDGRYRPVPGGCTFQTDEAWPAAWIGTIGTPHYDRDINDHVLVTAGHIFTTGANRTKMYQPYNDATSFVGKLNTDKLMDESHRDCAVVHADNADVSYRLAEDSGEGGDPIFGTLGNDEIKDKEGDSNYSLTKHGASTHADSGPITGVSSTQFTTDTDNETGDSGGPHFRMKFHPDFGMVAYIAGIHRGERIDSDDIGNIDDSVATKMENIEGWFNLER